ncbi:pyrroline-5-carboxylate reductase dimerization domain-containing protein [Aquamicrobium sp. LC103]|uniref:pyrroline-5-carboxylate reductase family protein n=1 Tax=Aquamicrobium sp. LC103 TaxID=1120658 RepID=UPI00063EAE84|nr:pyrroline-5-carboxylate reductase dimerization domain-containing protein [Aquamicrobium sp. LC103]TKT78302.1 pyrroline-5-carboxylate reductase [Aquamicrobium sp. LC103]
MSRAPTVGIIGGGGWLGGSIASQALAAGAVSENALIVSSRSPRAGRLAQWPAVEWTADNEDLIRRSDVVILSVRPHQFFELALDLTGKLAISVMAGVSMNTLRSRLGTARLVRSMPNAAAEIGLSYTPWLAGAGVTEQDRAFISALFESCGTADEVASEDQLDYLTGLSGSGPAFPALLASAMMSHAQARGLPPEIARRAVIGVVCNASRLLTMGDATPEQAVRTFIDYDGTTAAGLRRMMHDGFAEAVHAGLDAAASAATAMDGARGRPTGSA